MFNRTKRIMSFALAVTIVLSLSACNKSKKDDSSSGPETVYEYEYVDANGNPIDKNGNKSSSSGTGSNNGGGSTTGGNGSTGAAVDASKYKGTTVRYATWKDPSLNEDADAVKSFEKKYGIKVKIDMVDENDYVNIVTGMIAAGNSPDVIFCNSSFPAVLSVLQPIDAAQIDKSDDFWDQSMFNLSTVNGKTYLLNAVGNIWNEVDCLFYSKSLLKKANCYTPEEYAAQGKWNWAAMEQIMKAVDQLGSKYTGGTLEIQPLMASIGAPIYSYNNGTFSNGMNSLMTDAYKKVSTWFKDGIASTNTYDFRVGNAGLCVTNAFGLKKTGYFFDSNWSDIGCYYLPDYDAENKASPCGIFRGWGIAKGSQNPVAGGIFLKHYLDVDNYKISDAFINSNAERFFFELTTGETGQKVHYFSDKQNEAITGISAAEFFHTIPNEDPAQVAGSLAAQKNAVDNAVNKLNDYISRIQ